MKTILFTAFLFASLSTFAQNVNKDDLEKKIKPLSDRITVLEDKNVKLTFEINALKTTISNLKEKIDSLKHQTNINNDAINQTKEMVGLKIASAAETAEQKISDIDYSLRKIIQWVVIGVLFAVVAFGIAYWLLSKKQRSDKTDMIKQLSKTKSAIEESLVNEFDKQTELMDAQLEALKMPKTDTKPEHDHSLALKLASEINIIERNINLMDSGTKGLKQLTRSVEKLKDNLAANGYEMPRLVGKQFHEGMKVIVENSVPDEKLEKGAEIITKVLIPQVNYKGVMIQAGHIEVSVGY